MDVDTRHQQHSAAAANGAGGSHPAAPIGPAPFAVGNAPQPVAPASHPVVLGGTGVPIPRYESRMDPKSHLADLDAWGRLMGTTFDAPGRLADTLQLSVIDDKAKSWVRHHRESVPNSTRQQTADAFVERFTREARASNMQAQDKLFNRLIRMKHGMSVSEYFSNFCQQIMYCPEMHEIDRIRWFQNGLSPSLKIECAVDHLGNEFETFDAVAKYALGAERRAAVKQQQLASKYPRFSMMQKRENREWLELEEFAPQTKQPRTEAGTAGCFASFGEGASFTPGRGGGRFSRGGFRGGGAGRGGRGAGPFSTGGNGPFRGGRGGRGGRGTGGPGRGGAGSFKLSHIHHPVDGRLLSMHEVNALRKMGGCYNCLEVGHHAGQCTQPKKPYADKE